MPEALLALWVLLAVTVACGGPGANSEANPDRALDESSPARAERDLRRADLWFSFEDPAYSYDGDLEYADALERGFRAVGVRSGGADLDVVQGAGDDGDAVGFPKRCATSPRCPHAMLEVASSPALNPGSREFTFGAAVWLAADETTSGSNIVQKGRFGTDGGQWKLQVDSLAGEPSCVVRSGAEPLIVRSSVAIADSSWHRVECHRDASGLSIRVDGILDRVLGATGSVDNDWPLRIGSPGVGPNDDQFHGRVDDVFLVVGQ